MIKDELISNITVVTKTFNRPDCVERLYSSMRLFYPQLPLIVVDDGDDNVDDSLFDDNVMHIKTDFDIGVSKGRNIAVSNVETKYVLLLDDDFMFTEESNLAKLVIALKETDSKIIGTRLRDYGLELRLGYGVFRTEGQELFRVEEKNVGSVFGYPSYEYIPNCFLAETQLLRDNIWDDALKTEEHWEFFWRMSKDLKVNPLMEFSVFFDHYPSYEVEYSYYRHSRGHEYNKKALEKHNFKKITRVPSSRQKLQLTFLKERYKKKPFYIQFYNRVIAKFTKYRLTFFKSQS